MSTINEKRDRLLALKLKTDAELWRLKATLQSAKVNGAHGKYMKPEDYQALQADVRNKQLKSQELQLAIGVEGRKKPPQHINGYFRDAAKQYLSEETYQTIERMAFTQYDMENPK